MSLRSLFYQLPAPLRFWARRVWYLPYDILNPPKNPMIPPKGKIFIGSGDFEKQGMLHLEWFKTYAKLQAHHAVLDIGCGMGRMAVPLTSFLNANGTYHGFDIMEEGIHWCNEKIHTRYPHFHFHLASLKNDLYRNAGNEASQFTFPFPDASFDLQIATSLYTHMMPDEVQNYFHEMARVAKSGSRVFATFFILDDKAPNTMRNPQFRFDYDFGHYRLMDPKVRSANIAFTPDFLLNSCILPSGFELEKHIPGFWNTTKTPETISFQDILILKKSS